MRLHGPSWLGRLARRVVRLLMFGGSAYLAFLLCLSLLHLIAPQRNGPLALTQVVAPYLFAPLVLLLPFLLVRRLTAFRLLFLVCAFIFVARFMPRLHLSEPQQNPSATRVSVMLWNMHIDNPRLDEALAYLKTKPADVVALLEPEWSWYFDINNRGSLDAVYPYRKGSLLHDEIMGVALLSTYPILEDGIISAQPRLDPSPQPVEDRSIRSQWARLDLGSGRTLTVVAAHPYPPSPPIQPCRQPLCYDTSERDSQIAAVRAFVDPLLARGEPLLLMGDFNVTDREPGYRDLSMGLRDAFLEVGSGMGHTWRPDFLRSRELPVIRIDYMLSSPDVKPVRISTDCTLRGSDHCIIFGTFELER